MNLKTSPKEFRAWDKDRCEMIYWELFDIYCDESDRLYVGNYGKRYESELIVMQHTGFKDENGKKIFEGDIVKKNRRIGVVSYDDSLACFLVKPNGPYAFRFELYDDYELIGNIFENPELLEEK